MLHTGNCTHIHSGVVGHKLLCNLSVAILYIYLALVTFTNDSLFVDEGNLYHKAMAYGFDKVLDSYRKKLVDVEQKVQDGFNTYFQRSQHSYMSLHITF